MLYLSADSCYPGHVKRSIAFSLAKRIKAVCSTKELVKKRCDELTKALLERDHSYHKIKRDISRALNEAHGSRRANREEGVSQRIPLVIEYHPGLPNLKEILQRHQPLLHMSPIMKEIVPDLPMLAFSQSPNLKKKCLYALQLITGFQTWDRVNTARRVVDFVKIWLIVLLCEVTPRVRLLKLRQGMLIALLRGWFIVFLPPMWHTICRNVM